ncbi:MAG: cyclic nucleotide-binding domain-containing protein [Vicinamibacteria bacterium]
MPEARALPPLERMLHLKRVPMLAGLASPEIAVLADAAGERTFSRGEVVFREGEPVGSVHFVVRGSLATLRRGQRTGTVGPGGGVGGLALFARDPLGTQVVAEESTLTLELESDAVYEVLEDRFPILHHILRETSGRAIDLLTRFRLDPTVGIPECPIAGPEAAEVDFVDRIFFLRRQSVFRRSSITALADLARAVAQVRFEPGVTLWREGEPSPGIFLVGGGFLQATSSAGLSFRAGPGFPLGALEAVAERPRWYDVVTETPVTALQGHMGALVDVFEDNFEMAMDYLSVIAQSTLRIVDWSSARGDDDEAAG